MSNTRGRPLSKIGQKIRAIKVGEETMARGKHVRNIVYYASKSLGVRLVCNKVKGGFKITRVRKARSA